ncbi:MAG TPA: sigma-70 family RNA polymerase sigma factor [Gemmataceae bacterium]|nr:sigma-70 family RNA polymerase sigma factor [Gemmataceae bacterium]
MNVRVTQAIRHLQAAGPDDDRGRDAELLGAYVARRDPAAFETLVRRHGPMVMGVCRRVLGHAQDAEDAFQAAFLVLARRAAAIVPRDMVGSWLYGVAYRTALEARRMIARRRARETRVKDLTQPATEPDPPASDLSAVLDEELSRLTDRLRLPIVLCDLEGRTRRQAARQLGLPDGTFSNRLAAARRTLARRLSARGVTLTSAGLAVVLAQTGRSAVRPALIEATLRAAIGPAAELASAVVNTLSNEVVKAMYLTKLKVLAAVVLVFGAAAGTGIWGGRALTAEPAQVPNNPTPVPPKAPAGRAVDLKGVLVKSAEEMKSVKATGDEALSRKADRLVRIAHSQARYGDKAGAAATFQDALAVAGEITAEDKRAEAMVNVGFYQANAGLTDDARKTVEKIAVKSEAQTQDYRGQVQGEIASALAKAGEATEAVKEAEAIPDRVIKYKDKDGKAVERRDTMRRDWALQHIIEAQLKAGDAAGAAKTVARVKGEASRVSLVQEVIKGLAKAGDTAAAGKLLDELKAEMEKSEMYKVPARRSYTVAMMQAAIGDAAGALAWIEKIESAEERSDALGAVSIGLAYREQWKKK